MTTNSPISNHCRLEAIGILNCAGSTATEVLGHVLTADSRVGGKHALLSGRSVPAGAVTEELPVAPAGLKPIWSRNASLAFAAFRQFEPKAAELCERYGSERIGIVLGSSTSGIAEGERAVRAHAIDGELPSDYFYSQQEMGAVSESLARATGIRGPCYTISTACSSSARVFQSGRRLLSSGLCDAVIVGGVDSLCGMTLNGFSSLELLSDEIARPFSRNRNGINIGEGACLFLMTGAPGGVQLLGVGDSSDAYHISSPDPSAKGAIAALEETLRCAGITAADVDYVNLHGTGTAHNDEMEARAIAAVFPSSTPCSSTKPIVGHLLGASGATEAGICWLLLDEFSRSGILQLPPHRYDGGYDDRLPAIRLVGKSETLQPRGSAICVSNSFGFGGSNCALALGAERV
jgi:3-oxoacyl-[acyl-carrier-protein] synthase-1